MSVRVTTPPENARTSHEKSHYTDPRPTARRDDLGFGPDSLCWRVACGEVPCDGRTTSGRPCRRRATARVDGRFCCEVHHPDVMARGTAASAAWFASLDLEARKGICQSRVSDALKAGQLRREPCVRRAEGTCFGRIDAHHEDYDRPLEVVWLCRRHHQQADRARRAREGQAGTR